MMNRIETIGIISFKPNLKPLRIEFDYVGSDHSCVFSLHYDTSLHDKFLSENKGSLLLETSSYIELEEYVETLPSNDNWQRNIFLNHIEKMNYAIDLLRYSYNKGNFTNAFQLRNIGEHDFLFHKLLVNNIQSSSTVKISYGESDFPHIDIKDLAKSVPFEWRMFTRAKDLLNLGFFNESLIIAFNLLDYCVQKTIKSLMINLTSEKEKDQFLKQVKEQRLKTYLGPLFKTLTGKNFYNKKITEKMIDKINFKRNKIVHDGQNCSYEEVCESLKIILFTIQGLNENGTQNFEIPVDIIFCGHRI
jgi:hypothetical protein